MSTENPLLTEILGRLIEGAETPESAIALSAKMQHHDMTSLREDMSTLINTVDELGKSTRTVTYVTGAAALAAIATFIAELVSN